MLKRINKKRNKKGFTLVELVVVIAILGILAALAVPRLTGSRDKANRSVVRLNLRTIESALSIAEADGKEVIDIPSDQDSTDSNKGGLVGLGYLNAEPKGPSGVTYKIVENRATVNLKAGQFGFKKSDGSGVTADDYTLFDLSEE